MNAINDGLDWGSVNKEDVALATHLLEKIVAALFASFDGIRHHYGVRSSCGGINGYHNDPALTAEQIRDGWLRTGDLGRFDEQGNLFIVGRVKDMIIYKGYNVYPAHLEGVLSEHPEVLDVLVHIDPDDEVDPDLYATRLPSRDVLLDELQPLLAGLPPPEKVVLHYLNGKVEVELFLGHAFFENGDALKRAENTLAERLKMHATVRSISLNCTIAPN